MSCPHCGSVTKPGQKFCAECGQALATACPNCGTPYEGSPRFCGECGSPLTATADPNGASAGQGGDGSGRPAERRFVSVLFADLVGFTTRSEKQDAEEVRDLLSRYFGVAREVIEGYGGTIEKFIGDAVMAVWGAPVAREDDPERAVRAALELVDRVRELGDEGRPLQLRAAVMSGEAAVMPGGQGESMVAGDLVNTASRLQSVAPPGAVLVGETTQQASSAAIAYETAGDQLLKGKEAPVAAWRAVRVVAQRGGVGRGDGLEPPFVGRDEELRLLKDQLHAAGRERKLRLVSISGQAGMGKSRLAWELLKYIDGIAEDIYWHQGRSPSYGEGVTYWALGEMVRRRCGIAEGEDAASTRQKLHATLSDFVPDEMERRRLEPALAGLLGIEETDWDAREQLFAAWRSFFEWVAQRGTTVLVFEDLQWADGGLLDFVEHVLEWSRERPILVVTLARPELLERRPNFGVGKRALIALHLEPLSDEAMIALLGGLVPDMPQKDLQRVVARAEGVPLYAVETVRSLLDAGHLTRRGEVYELVGALPALDVPPTLRALIASRLDSLQPPDRALLQDASVLGVVFAVPALAALSDRSADEVESRLRALSQKELVALETDPRSPERGQYRFLQGLIGEVAYASLAKRERRARHLAAARHFEASGDEELAGVLASHYLEAYRVAPEGDEGAAVAAQARVALRAAAERASRLHSHEQALAYLEQALAVTFEEEEQARLRIQAARSANVVGQWEIARAHLQAALSFFEQRGDKIAAAETAAVLAEVLNSYSRVDEAIALSQRMLADLPPGAERGGIDLNAELARSYMFQGKAEQGLDAISRALETVERLGLREPTIGLLITKSWAAMVLGRPMEATALLWGAMRMADDASDLHASLRARMNLSAYVINEDPRLSLQIAEEGMSLARHYGMAEWVGAIAGNAASASVTAGLFDHVLELEADILENAPGPHSRVVGGYTAVALALRGEFDGARERLARLAEELEGTTSAQDVGANKFMHSMLALGEGNLAAARELAHEAIRIYPGADGALAIAYAANVAALLGDLEGLRADHALLSGYAKLGAWIERAVRTSEAGIAALEGRTDEAVRGYRRVLDEQRTEELWLDLGLTLFVRARLLGDVDEEARAGAGEARDVFERIGASGLDERLERGADQASVAAGMPSRV